MGNPEDNQNFEVNEEQHQYIGSGNENLHEVPSHPSEINFSFSVDMHPGSYPTQPNPTPVPFPPPSSYPSQPNQNPVSVSAFTSHHSKPNESPVSFPPSGSFPSPQNQNPNPVSFPPPSYAIQLNSNQVSFASPGPGVVIAPPSPYNGIPVAPFQVAPRNPWSTSLFDCMDDPTNALITCFFPCITFGQIAEILDNGQTSCATGGIIYGAIAMFLAAPCIYSCSYRSKLRSRYNLDEIPGPDWLVHLVCECCALCQAYRELRNQGWDPSIGWQENVRVKQGLPVQMTAPNPPIMM